MALEAAVLSRAAAGLFGRCAMAGAGGAWNGLFGGGEGLAGLDGGDWDAAAAAFSSMLLPQAAFQELDISAVAATTTPQEESGGRGEMSAAGVCQDDAVPVAAAAAAGRRKRRRTRTAKNSEEVESQRMTHIAVERNRRKQMNEYLAALRSLMPPSYTLRGDQASIVGGAINFVKELEQLLQTLETHRQTRERGVDGGEAQPPPFANFFTFPQYSMSATSAPAPPPANNDEGEGADGCAGAEASGSKPSAVADVEVTMVESHANLRMLSRRRPRQLLRLLVGLQGHRLTVLHLNMSSAGHMVLYSLSLKVEDDCQLTSVDEIATAAHQIVEKIQEEQEFASA
ncbi:hypothetical protein ACQJBY_044343 [Aegilops geniculata]